MAFTKKTRELVFSKTKGICFYCGNELGQRWHIDHFTPINRSFNPTEERWIKWKQRLEKIDNLVPSCQSCNIIKHRGSIEQFRKVIVRFVDSLNRDSTQYKFAKKYGLVIEKEKTVEFWFEKNNIDMEYLKSLHAYDVTSELLDSILKEQ